MSHRPRFLVILGPTASGKTALALDVARLVDGEIISADSRQAYRGLEIGTAAPTIAERAAVPHHGVAFLEPGDRYGAGRFARLCREWITDIESRGRTPIVVGGTGFFVRAVTHPVFKEPDLDSAGRAALEAWLSARPLDEIRRLLNPTGVPEFEACATVGTGVFETLKAVARAVLSDLKQMSK